MYRGSFNRHISAKWISSMAALNLNDFLFINIYRWLGSSTDSYFIVLPGENNVFTVCTWTCTVDYSQTHSTDVHGPVGKKVDEKPRTQITVFWFGQEEKCSHSCMCNATMGQQDYRATHAKEDNYSITIMMWATTMMNDNIPKTAAPSTCCAPAVSDSHNGYWWLFHCS